MFKSGTKYSYPQPNFVRGATMMLNRTSWILSPSWGEDLVDELLSDIICQLKGSVLLLELKKRNIVDKRKY